MAAVGTGGAGPCRLRAADHQGRGVSRSPSTPAAPSGSERCGASVAAQFVDVTTKRALVLGGGGVAGIAWETGILIGIADESPAAARALLDSDVLLGTSAGSSVVAQITSGLDLAELLARQGSETSAALDPRGGIDA